MDRVMTRWCQRGRWGMGFRQMARAGGAIQGVGVGLRGDADTEANAETAEGTGPRVLPPGSGAALGSGEDVAGSWDRVMAARVLNKPGGRKTDASAA